MDPWKMMEDVDYILLKMMDFNFYLRLPEGKYTWDSNYLPLFCTFLMFLSDLTAEEHQMVRLGLNIDVRR